MSSTVCFSLDQAGVPGPAPADRPVESLPSSTLKLDESSDGKSFSANIGTRIEVTLSRGLRWSAVVLDTGPPQARAISPAQAAAASPSPSTVLDRQSFHTAADGTSVATFTVGHEGTATLSAQGRANCAAGHACPHFVRRWRVSITVP